MLTVLEDKGTKMKTVITSLAVAAALSFSVAPAAIAASNGQAWANCNIQYAADLRDGSDTTIATNVGDAVAQGSANISNWAAANRALAECYRNLQ